LIIQFLNQGDDFDRNKRADPLVPENLLKFNSGRILFMQNCMDDLFLCLALESGAEARLVNEF